MNNIIVLVSHYLETLSSIDCRKEEIDPSISRLSTQTSSSTVCPEIALVWETTKGNAKKDQYFLNTKE